MNQFILIGCSIIAGVLAGGFLIPPLLDRLATWWLRRRLDQAGKIREGARVIGRLAPAPLIDIKADQMVTGEDLAALEEKTPPPASRGNATTRMIRR